MQMQISGVINVTQVKSNDQQLSPQLQPFAGIPDGEALSAEVVSVKGREVSMRTPDGSTVTTEFPEGVMVKPGDTVGLTMVSKSPNRVHLHLSHINGQTVNLESSELQVYLMERGMPPSKLNESAAQLLMRYNIDPSSSRVAHLIDIATALPNIPTSVAVLMAANDIPATAKNAEILMKWSAGPASLGMDIETLASAVQQEYDAVEQFSTSFKEAFLSKAGPEIQNLLKGGDLQELSVRLAGRDVSSGEAARIISSFTESLNLDPQQKQALDALLLQTFEAVSSNKNTAAVTQQAVVNTASGNEAEVQAQGTAVQSAGQEAPQSGQAAVSGGEAKSPEQAMSAEAGGKAGSEIGRILEDLGKLLVRMKGGDIPADGKTLQDSVKGQQELADAVKSGISRLMGDMSTAAQKADDLSAQIRLGNQMEQYFYCQIPFEINDRKNTAELYVFERKRGKEGADKTDTTILIGLDTQYMGRVETVLRAEPDRMSVEFKVENDDIEKYFSAGIEAFTAQMKDNGFSVEEVRITLIQEPVTQFNALKVMDREETVKQLTGIDIHV